MQTPNTIIDRLRGGVVLAELGGYGDGPYCATHGAGAALVMLGSYIVDAGDAVPYPPAFVFKPGRQSYAGYLQEHVAAARESGALVGVSICTVTIPDTVDFLAAAADAGADFISLCAHSTMEMFTSAGVSSRLLRRERWDALREWARAVVGAADRPAIFKIGLHAPVPDVVGALDVMSEAGVPIVHVDVGDTAPASAGLAAIRALVGHTPFLIAGGGVADLAGARRVLAAGADAVALGAAPMEDAGLLGRLQAALAGSVA